MKDVLLSLFVAVQAVGFVILLFLIRPILFIWAINGLSEAGGSSFYVDHSLWNYFVAFILLVLVRCIPSGDIKHTFYLVIDFRPSRPPKSSRSRQLISAPATLVAAFGGLLCFPGVNG